MFNLLHSNKSGEARRTRHTSAAIVASPRTHMTPACSCPRISSSWSSESAHEPQKSENGPIIVWTILARTRYLLSQLVSDPEPQEPLVASLAQTQGLTAPQVLVFLTKDIQVRRGQTCASRTHLDRPLCRRFRGRAQQQNQTLFDENKGRHPRAALDCMLRALTTLQGICAACSGC